MSTTSSECALEEQEHSHKGNELPGVLPSNPLSPSRSESPTSALPLSPKSPVEILHPPEPVESQSEFKSVLRSREKRQPSRKALEAWNFSTRTR